MERRNFLKKGLAVAGATSLAAPAIDASTARPKDPPKTKFKLNYAPHFGMFKNTAGEDPIDQLKFMADQGFMALEDNGMMGRTPAEQEKIGKEMTRLGMKMGVFVVDKGGNG
jgi:hydroxypyruvate isomerase